MTQLLFSKIDQSIKGNTWQEQHAGLTAITQCIDIFEKEGIDAKNILSLVEKCLGSNNF